jgi:hypothetical protein
MNGHGPAFSVFINVIEKEIIEDAVDLQYELC